MKEWIELIRKAEVKRRAGISNTSLHELLKGKLFPEPTYLTSSRRVPLWSASEIDAWLLERLNQRKSGAASNEVAQ